MERSFGSCNFLSSVFKLSAEERAGFLQATWKSLQTLECFRVLRSCTTSWYCPSPQCNNEDQAWSSRISFHVVRNLDLSSYPPVDFDVSTCRLQSSNCRACVGTVASRLMTLKTRFSTWVEFPIGGLDTGMSRAAYLMSPDTPQLMNSVDRPRKRGFDKEGEVMRRNQNRGCRKPYRECGRTVGSHIANVLENLIVT